jgi:hypothetical protein
MDAYVMLAFGYMAAMTRSELKHPRAYITPVTLPALISDGLC